MNDTERPDDRPHGGEKAEPPPPASLPTPPPPAASVSSFRAMPPADTGLVGEGSIAPTPATDREPILDVLRGFALLGILVVNIELMRGADLYRVLAGDLPEASQGADRIVEFGVAWLAAGKFVSSFSLLFGLGAALIVGRALAAGRPPRGLLARRYAWLLVFGLAHMVLLFPGDILFVYGLAGLILLAFVHVRARVALWWSAGLLAIVAAVTMVFTALAGIVDTAGMKAAGDDPYTSAFEGFFERRGEQAVAAFTEGSYLDIVVANAWQSLLVQSGQLFTIPWLLGLFLLGFAVARSGIAMDLSGHRTLLRRTAVVALVIGLPLNATLGAVEPLVLIAGPNPEALGTGMLVLMALAQMLGAPLLAVGYLSTLTLICLRWGAIRPLASVGRMALSAYLLQSLLALIAFAGFGLYEQLDSAEAMVVVVAIWTFLLIVCPLWLRSFRFGPAEWLWRSLTYGQRQPLRRASR